MTTGTNQLPKRRGRPRSERPAAEMGYDVQTVGPLTAAQVLKLQTELRKIPGVAALADAQQHILEGELLARLPYFTVTKNAAPFRPQGRRGPPPRAYIRNLLLDCAGAWTAATGVEPKLWETVETGNEAATCTIARVAIQIVEGLKTPWSGALHDQIAGARGVLNSHDDMLT